MAPALAPAAAATKGPLELLKDFNLAGRLSEVVIKDNKVDFGNNLDFPRKTKTGFRSRGGMGDFYEVDAVTVFLKNKDASITKRILTSKQLGVNFVSTVDQRRLLNYLEGRVDKLENEMSALPAHAAPPIEFRKDGSASVVSDATAVDYFSVPSSSKEVIRSVKQHESRLHDNQSVLMCPSSSFAGVLSSGKAAIEELIKQEEEEQRQEKERPREPAKPAKLTSTSTLRYEHFEKDKYLKNRLGGNVDINEYGDGGQGSGVPAEVVREERLKREREREKETRRKQEVKKAKLAEERQRESHSKQAAAQRKKMKPIIIVPSGFDTIINKYNSKEFFEKGRFQSWEGLPPPRVPYFTRTFKRAGAPVAYKFTDVLPRDREEWKRVVAVVVTGKKWQFKGFPHEGAEQGRFAKLFFDIRGFYFHFSMNPIPKDVQQWNVKTIALDKNNRHKDIAAHRDFWTMLDEFVKKKIPPFPYEY